MRVKPRTVLAVRVAAKKATTVAQLVTMAGWKNPRPNSKMISNMINLLGVNVYDEIASGRRKTMKSTKWTMPQ